MDIRRLSLSAWDDHLPDAGFEVFHTSAALSTLDDHASGDLTLLGGFKGQSAVALLPVFVRSAPVGRAVFSPPPMMGVPRLGPLVMPNSPKQSKRESITGGFVEGIVDELDADGPLSLVRLRCGLSFDDPRPFHWDGFGVEPAFTYRLPVDSDDLAGALEPASSSLRRELKLAADSEVSVTLEGVEGAKRVVDQVRERYDQQDRAAAVTWPFVRDLVTELDERARVYVARDPGGTYLSGIVALVSNDAVYYWQGGVRASYEEELEDGSTRSISANAALHAAIIEDICTDPALADVREYDLVGANTARLCEYKSKFGGRLRPYYVVESSGAGTRLAKSGYRLLAGQK